MPSVLSHYIYHAQRITKLVHTWDNLRGPGMAMPAEDIDSLLLEITHTDTGPVNMEENTITPHLERIQKAERVLLNTLTDDVYLNDDRDREIIVARMTLCNTLKQIRNLDDQIALINDLW